MKRVVTRPFCNFASERLSLAEITVDDTLEAFLRKTHAIYARQTRGDTSGEPVLCQMAYTLPELPVRWFRTNPNDDDLIFEEMFKDDRTSDETDQNEWRVLGEAESFPPARYDLDLVEGLEEDALVITSLGALFVVCDLEHPGDEPDTEHKALLPWEALGLEAGRTVNVDWDTEDNGETLPPEALALPRQVAVPFTVPEDEVSDWLSNTYGYCVYGWRHTPAAPETETPR